jgi:ADP-L-glycero-D-manno-heptose 6-epimerase
MRESPTLLVTGAAGFIGSRFVERCNRAGTPVVSVDHPGHFRERPEHAGIDFGRIIDRERLFEELPRLELGAIVHLGACARTTELDEAYLERVNVEYSKRLWEHATREGLPFVYASSAATYGDGALGYDDDESLIGRLRPLNPYGESKRRFDLWALEQEAAGRTPQAWSGFKFFNVYGFGERHKGPMASVVLHSFDQIRAHGVARLFRSHRPGIPDGEQKRDFVCVEDVLDVLGFALSKPLKRGIYNLGTGRARSFLDLARAVFRALGSPERIEFFDTPEAIRSRYQYFTEARMQRLLSQGYAKPFTSLEDGVSSYVRALLR